MAHLFVALFALFAMLSYASALPHTAQANIVYPRYKNGTHPAIPYPINGTATNGTLNATATPVQRTTANFPVPFRVPGHKKRDVYKSAHTLSKRSLGTAATANL
ncbi:hypothetical protein BJ170DRAFT_680682 [Xylariales sp. AK1849]|nr:hypothetical protein BJ170DRAFT_680682 [Xylariales sp. AK1849]